MNVNDLVDQLGLEVLTTSATNKDISGVYIGDLLSFVMSHANKEEVWLTVQSHVNVIAIASLLELSAIVVVEDAEVDDDTVEKANEENIVVLKTNMTAYELAVKINQFMS